MLTIDIAKGTCIRCGRCVAVCPMHILTQTTSQGAIGVQQLETCIQCGHCAAICPVDALSHSTFPKDRLHTINKALLPSPDGLLELMRARRSNRAFDKQPIPQASLERIMEAARLAPSASNSRKLSYTIVTNPAQLKIVTNEVMGVVELLRRRLRNPINRMLLKLFAPHQLKKEASLDRLSQYYHQGTDLILRDAQALILIHAPAHYGFGVQDANLAYQNASLMAEALGVAHFYTGFITAFSERDKRGRIKACLGIKGAVHAGMALGMPRYRFGKYVDRD